MKNRRVLMISTRKILPATDGGLIGSLGMVQFLHSCKCSITLVTFYDKDDYNDIERNELLNFVDSLYSERLRWNKVALNISFRYPNNIRKYTRKCMADTLLRIKNEKQFDLVVIDHLHMFEYTKLFKESRIILNAHNVESDIWNEYSKKYKGIVRKVINRISTLTYKYECFALQNANGVIACSDTDAKSFKEMMPEANIVVMHPYRIINQVDYLSNVDGKNFNILFVGSYNWYPNQSAVRFLVEEIMPLIRIKISNAKLMLVGKNPTDEMKNYANKYSDVVVTGEVDSVDPYYQQANVFVNAVYEGSGINIKMIEAMGKGLPIVSSEYGARGINCEFINFGYLYQDASECADYIAKLSKDKSLAVKMAKTARECYEQFNIPQNDVMKMLFDNL